MNCRRIHHELQKRTPWIVEVYTMSCRSLHHELQKYTPRVAEVYTTSILLWKSRAPKKKTSHGNKVLPQDTTHLKQRPCYQQESPWQDPAGNRTTWRRPDHHKRHKLQWYGHVSRSSGLAKTIQQGTVRGGRRQGRQRKRWENNIREWTGLEFAKSRGAVENRERWRKLVVKSSMVPQRPSWLRDRWWWWWGWYHELQKYTPWVAEVYTTSCKSIYTMRCRSIHHEAVSFSLLFIVEEWTKMALPWEAPVQSKLVLGL